MCGMNVAGTGAEIAKCLWRRRINGAMRYVILYRIDSKSSIFGAFAFGITFYD